MGVDGIQKETTQSRFALTAVFAGRVWYAGIDDKKFAQTVFFSQQIGRNDTNFGDCYQENDPTSDQFFDLLKTDGGTITIPDIGEIVNMVVLGRSLLLFSNNGVWAITGNEALGFTATDFTQERINTIGAIDRKSFVIASGTPIWWNYDGIYGIRTSRNAIDYDISDLTLDSIKTFYQEIPNDQKTNARAIYNTITSEVQWIYGPEDNKRILVFDALNNVFYPWSFDNSLYKFKTAIGFQNLTAVSENIDIVTTGGDNIITTDGDTVVSTVFSENNTSLTIKYLVTDGTNDYLMTEDIFDHVDWKGLPNGDTQFRSFFDTGYRVRGNANRKTQVNWLIVWSEVDLFSSCFVSALWDYSNSGDTGNWSRKQQAISNRRAYDYGKRRLKIRGSGYAVQFRFESEENKPFTITGWSSFETGNAAV
jgi:hypothetical protein